MKQKQNTVKNVEKKKQGKSKTLETTTAALSTSSADSGAKNHLEVDNHLILASFLLIVIKKFNKSINI